MKGHFRHIVFVALVTTASAIAQNSGIVSKGVTPNLRPKMSSASELLHLAALRGETASLEMMLQLHAPVDALDGRRRTSLHDACLKGHVDAARVLLKHGANINARDEGGATPLHDAALGGDAQMVEYLLRRKADPSARDSDGLTPLDYAQRMSRTEAVHALTAVNR